MSATMRAWVYRAYGAPEDVVHEEQLPMPTPGDKEVLVRVRASGLNAADWHLMRADPALARTAVGLRRPRRPMLVGSDVAGEVAALGPEITDIAVGDRVMAEDMMHAGLAEFVAIPAERIGPIPEGLEFERAAAIPMAGVTAMTAIVHRGRVHAGQSVLVVGASGGVGTFAVQIARALGGHVSAVCSARAADLVRSLGADEVYPYEQMDLDDIEHRFDLVLRIGGTDSLRDLRAKVAPGGTLAAVGGSVRGGLLGPGGLGLRAMLLSPFVGQRLLQVSDRPNGADLRTLAAMIEAGSLEPVIDRVYPAAEAVAAMQHLEHGHPLGKVVVTLP